MRALKDSLDLLVLLESRVLLGKLDPRDRRDLRVMWGRLGQRGILVPLDLQALREILERQEIPVPRVLRESLARLEKRGKLAPRAKRGQLAR